MKPTAAIAKTLYMTDNGRILCRKHLGHCAATTGFDISGQAIECMTAADISTLSQMLGGAVVGCENCNRAKRAPALVLVPGGLS